jgi:hypothetical protein
MVLTTPLWPSPAVDFARVLSGVFRGDFVTRVQEPVRPASRRSYETCVEQFSGLIRTPHSIEPIWDQGGRCRRNALMIGPAALTSKTCFIDE